VDRRWNFARQRHVEAAISDLPRHQLMSAEQQESPEIIERNSVGLGR
jgi:hypothetical protein